jgi:hypothetical protein
MSENGGILGKLKSSGARWTLEAITGGTALAVVYKALEVVQAKPEFLPLLLNSGFLPLGTLVVGMLLFGRRMDRFNANQLRSVIANEQLAANVGALVAKDDTRAQALEAAMRYVASDTRQILSLLNAKPREDSSGG